MHASLTTRAVFTAAAVGLLCLPAAPSAFATAGTGTYTVPVHQDLPVTAAGFGEHEAKCGSIGTNQDGWHFVLPGNSTDFVKLTVAFDNGAPQVVTVFGPPTTKHAYVASAPGAKLTSASAEVKGGEVKWFNLSHTCPAVNTTPTSTPSTTPTTTPSSTPTTPTTKPSTPAPSTSTTPAGTTSPSVTTSPSASASISASGSPNASTTAPATTGPSVGSTATTGSTVAAGGAGSPSPSASAAASGADSLASTGANVGVTLVAALGLVGAGAVLVMRRRKAGQH